MTGAAYIYRENNQRFVPLKYSVRGRDLGSTVAEAQQRVGERVKLPEGYFVEYAGQFESQQRATTLILILAAVSVVGMFVVLMILYPSVRIVLQILNALPFPSRVDGKLDSLARSYARSAADVSE